jgi:NTP pyrophosphatase (non-canonical NTP hydrolase)
MELRSKLSSVRDVQAKVAQVADKLGLHANAPTLTLTLLTEVGRLADEVLSATAGGRRPFRPGEEWQQRLADVAFTVINLADQTGVQLDDALHGAIARREAAAPQVDDLPGW